jgi:hypothetical protein
MGEDFRYKEYSEQESRIYNEAMTKIMEALRLGQGFPQACKAVHIEDEELREYIEDDALKIAIAEMHFVKEFSIEEAAGMLEVPPDLIAKAIAEMMEDMEIMTSEIRRMNNPEYLSGNA